MRSFRLSMLACALTALVSSPAAGQTHSRGLEPSPVLGFGTAAAVADGQIFVGRPGEFAVFPMPGSEAGTVHVFRHGPSGWVEYAAVSVPDGEIGDGFGSALAAHGSMLVIGAPNENEGRGAAYVFTRDGDVWTQLERLEAPDAAPDDRFGTAIAIEPGSALVGAPGRSGTGSAFAYAATAEGFTSVELKPSSEDADSNFGAAVSLEGDLALVGAPGPFSLSFLGGQPKFHAGSGYVFRRSGEGWTEESRLTTPSGGSLGLSALLQDGRALLGAPIADQGTGAVFVFAPDESGAWASDGKLSPETPRGAELFGFSMGRAGPRLVVGAPGPPQQFEGAAYVFGSATAGGWQQEAVLEAEIHGLMGWLGNTVAGGDDFVVVGAPGSEFFEGIGFVFSRDASGEWTEETSIVESDAGLDAVTGGEQRCGDDGMVAGFACQDVELLSFLPVTEVGGARGIMVSDIWGWTDPDTGREYAILGRFDGTSFIDVTDAENPVFLGDLPLTEGAHPNLWRDMKVYANHTFIVADNAGEHGIQIFDLTRLRDVTDAPVRFDEDAHYSEFASAHNIVINEESGFAYVVGGSGGGETCGGALHMVDLRDPRNPQFAGCYADLGTGNAKTGYTHDAQCVMYHGPDPDYEGHEICFNASETALGIGDVTDKANPAPISNASYPNVGYSHQGWLSEDHRYFYLDDELDELQGGVTGTRTLVWDIEDLDDPILATEYLSDNPSSDHNLYIRGQFMYQSNYVSGLRVFDISDPENPKPIGYFDTVPWSEDAPGFAGSWSNYPFFESGTIIVSSMREGLFVLKKRQPELVP